MGWKGTMRSIAAASRAAERDAERRRKLALKEQMAAEAADAVENWENHIDDILNIHTELSDTINWYEIANTPKPLTPVLDTKHEDNARASLKAFKPSFFDFFRGGSEKIKNRLVIQLEKAPAKDKHDYDIAIQGYSKALSDWRNDTKLARELLEGKTSAIKEVIEEMQALSSENLIGSNIRFIIQDKYLHARPEVHSDEIIPNYRLKRLASGKLSETKMPTGQFNELYQDYIASVALKVAGELFQITPLNEIYVTCESNMLNSQTGHMERVPILSVQFIRDTFMKLNLERIDPSDSIRNFNHNMNFKKNTGFSATSSLKPND